MKEIDNPSSSRHVSRFIAVLTLYSSIISDSKSIKDIAPAIITSYKNKDIFYFHDLHSEDLLKPNEEFLNQLINIYEENKIQCLECINKSLIEKYKFEKLDKALQAIISFACTELLYFGDVPAMVIIDEYVNITKTFYESSEIGFINKVIDNIAHTVRADELKK